MSNAVQTLIPWRLQARAQAIAAGIDPLEVDELLHRQGWTRLDQALGRIPQPVNLPELDALWQRRIEERIPLAYLLGWTPWRDLELRVTPEVLIPRPETELLIDVAAAWAQEQAAQPGIWVDLGTGSGAIAIGLARTIPVLQVYAVDISPGALAVAAENVQRSETADRVQLLQGSWFAPLQGLQGRIQGMVANPPYIPSAWLPQLQPEVSRHEPWLALSGGESGLDCLYHLVAEAPQYLQSGGFWLVEVMQGQSGEVAERLRQTGRYSHIQIHRDLAGVERMVAATVS